MAGDKGLHWHQFGQGLRRALALHPGLTHGGVWRGVSAGLEDVLTIDAPDLPGHGASSDAPGEWDSYVGPVADLLTDQLDRPIDLIGHSVGGVIALALATRHPEKIRSLTLVEPVLFAATRGLPVFEDHLEHMAGFAEAGQTGDRVGAAQAFLKVWGMALGWDAMKPHQQDYIRDRIHLVIDTDRDLFEDLPGVLHPGLLEQLTMPVLMVAGDQSPEIVHAIQDQLAARMPDVRRLVVPGASHMVSITHPAPVAQAMRAMVSA